MAGRFPKIPSKSAALVLPLEEWFAKYAEESKRAASTRKRWRPALATLEASVGHDDLARVTPDDVSDWVDALRAQGRGDKTIRDVYLASAKTLFGWLKGKRKVLVNPCAGLQVKVVEGPRLRVRSFSEAEASTILAAALVPHGGRLSTGHAAARRWVPWLCAYSGARAGEITQLRRKDVRREDGVLVLHITPEAGTVKTKQARFVPIHAHLVEMGFLDYVGTRSGPLFYDPARARGGSDANLISKKVGERLAVWVRKLGIDDIGVNPKHGWRHSFKTRGRRGGMRDSVLDAIQDDVLMSVDAGHRRKVSKLLRAEFQETQFVLTTHDKAWLKFMGTTKLVEPKDTVHFRKWTVADGPTIWAKGDVWTEIRTLADDDNVPGAAALLRRSLEHLSSEFCQALRAKVTFSVDGHYDLGDLLDPAISQMKALYKDARLAADSWKDAERVAAIQQREKAFEVAASLAKVEQWQINPSVHYNEWANLQRDEILGVVDAFEGLCVLFECDACGPIEVSPGRGSREDMQCLCGKVKFSFMKKSKEKPTA
jgi:integrase